MIDEAENLEEPEGYQHEEKLSALPVEVFPADQNAVPDEKKEVIIEPEVAPDTPKDAPKPEPKKIPPPLPPKPEHLKVKAPVPEPISESPEPESVEPEPEPSSIPLPESDIEEDDPEPVSEQPEPESEPYGIPGPSNTSAPAEMPEPETCIYMDERIEEIFKCTESSWERYGNDPEDYDWETLAIEIEQLPNGPVKMEDTFEYMLYRRIQLYRNRLNGNNRVSFTYPSNCDIAQKIRKYAEEERGKIRVKPEGGQISQAIRSSNINERECALARGDDLDSDYDDELDDLVEDMD
jgi:hypothetical protein